MDQLSAPITCCRSILHNFEFLRLFFWQSSTHLWIYVAHLQTIKPAFCMSFVWNEKNPFAERNRFFFYLRGRLKFCRLNSWNNVAGSVRICVRTREDLKNRFRIHFSSRLEAKNGWKLICLLQSCECEFLDLLGCIQKYRSQFFL